MRPNRDGLLNRQMRDHGECRGHGRCRLADGNHVQPARGEHLRQGRIRQGPFDHPRRTDRVNASADNGVQVVLER